MRQEPHIVLPEERSFVTLNMGGMAGSLAAVAAPSDWGLTSSLASTMQASMLEKIPGNIQSSEKKIGGSQTSPIFQNIPPTGAGEV